jgi:hypothetical protein
VKRLLLMIALFLAVYGIPGFAAIRQGEIGLGIVLGEPSGAVGQFFMTNNSLLDVTVAWSFREELNFMTAVDYQIYNNIGDAPREWSWYYGAGGYFAFPKHHDGILGVRVPLGIAYSFPHSKVDAWVEVDPGLRLIPDTDADLMGGIGVTFWIK